MNLDYLNVLSVVSTLHSQNKIEITQSFGCNIIVVRLSTYTYRFVFKDGHLFKISLYASYGQYDLTKSNGWLRFGMGFGGKIEIQFDEDYFLMEAMAPYYSILKQYFPNHHQSLFI